MKVTKFPDWAACDGLFFCTSSAFRVQTGSDYSPGLHVSLPRGYLLVWGSRGFSSGQVISW